MATRRALALSIAVAATLSGCGEDPEVDLPEETSQLEAAVSISTRDASSAKAECDQAPDGTPCGKDAGSGIMHCLYNACVLNVCGDGIKVGDEVCDDGDQDDADGCNSLCQEAVCGNGVVDAREQCDDGNTVNGDDCDKMCRETPRDGGGAGSGSDAGADAATGSAGATDSGTQPMDAGTETMDTGIADTGSAGSDAGTVDSGRADSGPAVEHDAAVCQACVQAPTSPCRDWFGAGDFVAGCFNNADPMIVERCVALYRCALRDTTITGPNLPGCAADPTGIVKCFCGTAPIDGACFTGGEPPNGPCINEVYAASGCTTPTCVEANLVAEGSASYYAQYLTLCTLNSAGCQSACPLPQQVPDASLPVADAGR